MRPKLPKKSSIIAQGWERIREESEAAKELLEDPRFSFLRDYLRNAQTSIVDHFVRNRIKTVQEQVKVSDNLVKTLTTTRRHQEYKLSGQHKFEGNRGYSQQLWEKLRPSLPANTLYAAI